jgi:hypothetical protein
MNYRQKLYQRNRLLMNIKHTSRSGSKEGYVKVWASNSLEHELTKLKITHKLKKQGFEVWSETQFINGGQADIIAIKDGRGYIIEILHSETIKQLTKKVKKYPTEFEVMAVKTEDFDLDKFEV